MSTCYFAVESQVQTLHNYRRYLNYTIVRENAKSHQNQSSFR